MTKTATEAKTYELMVVGFEGNPAHCVYVNDFRLGGGKPWGGGRTTARWRFSLDELRHAFCDLDIQVRAPAEPALRNAADQAEGERS